MAYEKRVCVLKQVKKGFTADGGTLSGAIYAERLGSELTVTPRMLGIAPVKEGRYALALWIEGKIFVLELKGTASLRVENAPSVKRGLAALVVFLRGEVQPIAFGSCGVAPSDYQFLLAAFSEEKRQPIPVPLTPNELPGPAPNIPRAPGVPLPEKEEDEEARPFREHAAAKYDDEAIAEQDYFRPHDEDGETRGSGGADENAQADGAAVAGDDGAVRPFLRQKSLTYYYSVREKLEEAFRKFPRDDRLKSAFPHSEWVRTETALLGVVYGHGIPEFLCVAVEKRGEAPEEMRDKCMFVPASPFSDEEGFFVVFQSASTGEYVTVSDT